MRTRLMQDLLDQDGVEWVALVGPDALPIDSAPASEDLNSAVAMWFDLDFLLEDIPARMLLRTGEALMLSHRVDENRMLLIQAGTEANLGSLRSLLENTAARIVDLA
jgi:predicted regulator of Ras-like GTPase activity (Roadblock/LC7/MglB family)